MYRKLFYLTALLFVLNFGGYSQNLNMRFIDPLEDKFTSGSYVTSLTQDTLGTIWVGTKNGLYSFNGANFNSYKYNPNDSNSIPNNSIVHLFADTDGRIWVTSNLGISIYNYSLDNFKTVANEIKMAGLKSLQISAIKQDIHGDIYRSSGKSIYVFNEITKTFSLFYEIEKGFVSSFIFDKENNLWIGAIDDGGVTFYDQKNKKTKLFNYLPDKTGLSSNEIRDIGIHGNKLWIATYGGGINSLNLLDYTIKRYPVYDSYVGYAFFVYKDLDNRLWTCDLTGLKLYDEKNDSFYGYYSRENNAFSIKEAVLGIFQDRQGNYWTYHSSGIGKRVVPKGFELYNSKSDYPWNIRHSNISAIAFDNEGNWWLGNAFNGIEVFNEEGYNVRDFGYDTNDQFSLGKGAVGCIFNDSQNNMWIGTNMGGLQYYDKNEDKFYTYVNNPNDTKSVANNDIRSIDEDKQGNLWVVPHGNGIDKFDRKNNIFYHYTEQNSTLSNDWAFQVLCDSEENIWVATVYGLNKLVKGASKFENYFYQSFDTTSLSSNEIYTIFEDSKHQLWVGTSAGLNKYNRETNNFTRYLKGFVSTYIEAIQEDESNNIWVSTKSGLSLLNHKNNQVTNFNYLDGLQKGEFISRSSASNLKGQLFFGGSDGMNVFYPGKLYQNTQKPKVLLSRLKLFNTEINQYGKNSILKQHIRFTDEIVLKYDENVFSIEYYADNLINAHKNLFRYKLDGLEKRWNEVGTKNEATYTHLSPGKYIFRVQGSNDDGIWNTEGASLKIRILPPWWLTWWFKTILVVFVFGMLGFVFYIRNKRFKKQRLVLEQKVEERTKELFEKNAILKNQSEEFKVINEELEERQLKIEEQSEELKSQTENLEKINRELTNINLTKDKLFSVIAHDLRNPFNSILGFSELFYNNYNELDDTDKIEMARNINVASTSVYNLLNNLLNWVRSQTDQISCHPVCFDVCVIIFNAFQLLEYNARSKNIDLKIIHTESVFVWADKEMVDTLVRNLISNAIKFTPNNGKIYVSVIKNGGMAEVSIVDNGIGMSSDIIQNLFRMDKVQSHPGTNGEKGSALGLILCKDFVERNKGELTVSSVPGKGSTFKFTLPLYSEDKK